jgi:glucose-6-phosphate isomerase
MLRIETKDALILDSKLKHLQKKLSPKISQLQSLLDSRNYSDDACSILLPDEELFLSQSQSLAKKLGTPALLIVIGIGGSNLGTMAVQEAVLGKHYNLLHPKTKVLYADTCDPHSLASISSIARSVSDSGGNVVLNLISKSGGTTESIANFEYLLSSLTYPTVVVTTDSGSSLHSLSLREGFHTLQIPKKLGGRYSVFSNVGLFPLSLLGIDVQGMLSGAKKMRNLCLADTPKNPAASLASIIYSHSKSNKCIFDQFLFSPDLESAGKWHRQLLAESIGKERPAGKARTLRYGITPTVSIGSTDLHSIGQLYLAGPRDKLFRLVQIAHDSHPHPLPHMHQYESLVPNIGGKTTGEIMSAIFCGVQSSFRKRRLPFISLLLADRSAESMGALLQLEMLETIYLAHLLDLNPFDQPAVEEYKREVRLILSRKTHGSR